MIGRGLFGLALLAGLALAPPVHAAPSALDLIEEALEHMGDLGRDRNTGPLRIVAEGTLDKSAEGQGYRPDQPSPGPYREVWVLDSARDRIAREYREERFDGTSEAFREVYLGAGERMYVVEDPPLVIPFRSDDFTTERRRLERRIPHLMLAELRARAPQLRSTTQSEGISVLVGSVHDGTLVEVILEDRLVRSIAYRQALSAKGHTTVRWWFDDYRPVDGVGLFPFRYGSTVGIHDHLDLSVRSVSAGGEELFLAPEGHRRIPVQPTDEPSGATASDLEMEQVFEGVYRVPEVRSGFAPLVVVFEDFVAAVDAPASFPMLGKVPAEETDPAPHFSWHSERFVDAIEGSFPDRPLRYLILTHAHEDHVGGVRAFVAAGATVLASPEVRPVVERICALPPREIGDRLSENPAPLRFETVDQPHTLADATRRLDLLPLESNPHAAGYLLVHLPLERALFVSDLVTPEPLEVYPREAHAALDRWFAGWLAKAGLEIETVLAMHGAPSASPAHFDRARD